MARTLKMILSNGCLQTGHSGLTFDHSVRHVLQKLWKHRSANALSSVLPRQIEQLGSGDADPDDCDDDGDREGEWW